MRDVKGQRVRTPQWLVKSGQDDRVNEQFVLRHKRVGRQIGCVGLMAQHGTVLLLRLDSAESGCDPFTFDSGDDTAGPSDARHASCPEGLPCDNANVRDVVEWWLPAPPSLRVPEEM